MLQSPIFICKNFANTTCPLKSYCKLFTRNIVQVTEHFWFFHSVFYNSMCALEALSNTYFHCKRSNFTENLKACLQDTSQEVYKRSNYNFSLLLLYKSFSFLKSSTLAAFFFQQFMRQITFCISKFT